MWLYLRDLEKQKMYRGPLSDMSKLFKSKIYLILDSNSREYVFMFKV